MLPNSKWANISWKHNFGPGTDFVVEYTDGKHCCVGAAAVAVGSADALKEAQGTPPGSGRPFSCSTVAS